MKTMLKGKFLKVCINKMSNNKKKNNNNNVNKVSPCTCCDQYCCQWNLWPFKNVVPNHEEVSIPKDVPKGHLVVYVGKDEYYKRFVIKIGLLNHPLFKALLDQARDEFDYVAGPKLCIPCDESLFLNVVRCATCPDDASCL